MLSYCLKCTKKTAGKNARLGKTNKGKLMLLSKRSVCGSKNQDLLKS